LTALRFSFEDQTIHHEGTKITKKSDLNILHCRSAAATELNLLDANFGSLFFVFFVPSW